MDKNSPYYLGIMRTPKQEVGELVQTLNSLRFTPDEIRKEVDKSFERNGFALIKDLTTSANPDNYIALGQFVSKCNGSVEIVDFIYETNEHKGHIVKSVDEWKLLAEFQKVKDLLIKIFVGRPRKDFNELMGLKIPLSRMNELEDIFYVKMALKIG
jgi:hypothetical protein